jgi:hypothetical protein
MTWIGDPWIDNVWPIVLGALIGVWPVHAPHHQALLREVSQ